MESQTAKYSLTEGGILKKLLQVAVPIMGTQFMQMAYNLTDLFWLGRVGSDSVAAAGAAGMYLWLSFGFLLIGRMGAEIGVSQSLGRGDKKIAREFSQNSMIIGLVLGLFFGLAMVLFNRYLIGFFNFREDHVSAMGRDYLFYTGIPMPLVFVTSVATASFNASGNSRTPFIFNSIGLGLNVALDPVFILVLGMGVKGAAIATVIAQFIACSALLIALFVSKHRPFTQYSFKFRPDIKKIVMLLKWALPIGLESILFCFLSMICSRLEASFGADAIAVAKIGAQIESLSWLIGGGFGSALIAYIGQNYGAQKWDRIHKGTKIAATVMAVWGSLVTLLFFTIGPAIYSIFLPAPHLMALGRDYLFIFAFCQLSMNLEAVASGAFKGIGKTIPPSLVSIISNSLRPLLAFILSRTSLGLYGIWIAVTITTVIRGLWICIWYILRRKHCICH
jgi:putative MATE family efflux protein